MNPSPSTNRPNPLTFDIEQWRQDIQTFVDATNEELSLIINELYGADPDRSGDHGEVETVATVCDHNESETPRTSRRLASLKEKLAKRIHQPDPSENE